MKTFFVLGLGIGLSIFLGGCFAWVQGAQSSPEKLAEAYLEAFREDDLQTMLQLSDSEGIDEEELAFLKRLIEMITLEDYRIDGIEPLSDNKALVKITVKLLLMGQEKNYTEKVRVVQKKGKWYLEERIPGIN